MIVKELIKKLEKLNQEAEKNNEEKWEIHGCSLEDFTKECSKMVGIINENGEEEDFPPIEKDN